MYQTLQINTVHIHNQDDGCEIPAWIRTGCQVSERLITTHEAEILVLQRPNEGRITPQLEKMIDDFGPQKWYSNDVRTKLHSSQQLRLCLVSVSTLRSQQLYLLIYSEVIVFVGIKLSHPSFANQTKAAIARNMSV